MDPDLYHLQLDLSAFTGHVFKVHRREPRAACRKNKITATALAKPNPGEGLEAAETRIVAVTVAVTVVAGLIAVTVIVDAPVVSRIVGATIWVNPFPAQ
jgi:hypothetical protein